ncbi:protease modulator HflC [Bacillus sp. SB49]|uniref:protease modulator HflC n=1 Tax=Bacillaceae TaxID=186817 RepID=UPI0002A51AF1|nr:MULTISPECIES: protease modulator HflC [Bacillaceae]ELK47275.1 membrane protease subunit, stomatin/prohibitin [Halobacillus sp. BAB-2008]QHT47390.1 protease modulator HflC [Bacillus sp. SB49]
MTDDIFDEKKTKNRDIRKYVKAGVALLVIIFLLLTGISSVVIAKEGEYKVVRQFGDIVKIHETPGLKFKVPFVQEVSTLSKKKMVYDVEEKEITTLDKKRMIIDNYAVWSIEDPERMIANARTVIGAEARMGEFIFSIVRSELGKMDFSEIINEEESSRGVLNDEITSKVNEYLARDNYGIVVDDVRIKRSDLPESNEAAVFNQMITDREKIAQQYLSEGEADKSRIRAEVDREVQEMLSTARANAEKIRSEGEQQAAAVYNESFSKDPEFYRLYRTLESYETTIDGETTIILPQDSPYTDLLQGYIE